MFFRLNDQPPEFFAQTHKHLDSFSHHLNPPLIFKYSRIKSTTSCCTSHLSPPSAVFRDHTFKQHSTRLSQKSSSTPPVSQLPSTECPPDPALLKSLLTSPKFLLALVHLCYDRLTHQPTKMAAVFANVLRARLFQLGAGLFCAAVLVANVDVKSVIVGNEPPIPTQTSPPPIHITTVKPSSTPLIWSTDPIKIPGYEPTTFSPESSAVKSIYVFDYIPDQPAVETARPEAFVKRPGLALETDSTSSTDTSAPPRPPRTGNDSTTHGNSTHTFYSTNQSLPNNYWMLKSIQDVLIEVKQRILTTFPGMAPSFGMVAWYQFRYLQFLRGFPTAEEFKSMALKLANSTIARDRKVNEYEKLYHDLENVTTRAVDLLEAVVEAKDTSDRNAAYEIARLKTIIAEEQHTSRQNTEKSTREVSRLKVQVDETIKKCEAAEANASKELRQQLEAAEERALQAGKRSAEAAELARTSEENASRKQSTIDFLSTTLATNRTAFIEAVEKAKEAKEHAEETAKILQEQVAEHKETAARSAAGNTKLKDELDSEKKEKLQLISSNENQRVKDAEEGRIRAEEAARRAKGEADHLVRSQAGQLNRAKAMNDTYQERYGKLDEAGNANAKPQAPNGSLHASSLVDSSETCPTPQGLNGTLDASSTADGRWDTCPIPGSSIDISPPSGPGRKKHRRGTRPRSSKKTSQAGEGLPAGTPTTEGTTRGGEVETGQDG